MPVSSDMVAEPLGYWVVSSWLLSGSFCPCAVLSLRKKAILPLDMLDELFYGLAWLFLPLVSKRVSLPVCQQMNVSYWLCTVDTCRLALENLSFALQKTWSLNLYLSKPLLALKKSCNETWWGCWDGTNRVLDKKRNSEISRDWLNPNMNSAFCLAITMSLFPLLSVIVTAGYFPDKDPPWLACPPC